MQSNLVLNLTEAPRVEKLKLFMRMQRPALSFVALARPLGITSAVLGRNCAKDTMPVNQHTHLVDLGIPSELLPEPLDRKPGPKPKIMEHQQAAAG